MFRLARDLTPGHWIVALALLATGVTAQELPSAKVGEPAPDFTLTDTEGKLLHLRELAGRTVVLEWFNPDCPFVRYAHTEGPLQHLGNELTGKGVVWLAVNSAGPGKQGHGIERNREARAHYEMRYPVLVDEAGTVGRMYRARTTPHMFVIAPDGTLAYRGALDNAPLGDLEGDPPINYVQQALTAIANQTRVAFPHTRPYGCSVKYANR